MTSKKISELDALPAMDGSENFPIAKGGFNYRATVQMIYTWIGAASTTRMGLMSASDKLKLNGIEAGATVNSTDAQLRDRATHTGLQGIDTIDGLATVADTGQYGDLLGLPDLTPAGLGAAPAGHVGLAGTAAHPIATQTEPGFIAPIEKGVIARLGGSFPVYNSEAIGATGLDAASAAPITQHVCRVTSSTTGTDEGVILPDVQVESVGAWLVFKNASPNAISLYPFTGGQVNFAGVDTPMSVGAYETRILVSIGTNMWDRIY